MQPEKHPVPKSGDPAGSRERSGSQAQSQGRGGSEARSTGRGAQPARTVSKDEAEAPWDSWVSDGHFQLWSILFTCRLWTCDFTHWLTICL